LLYFKERSKVSLTPSHSFFLFESRAQRLSSAYSYDANLEGKSVAFAFQSGIIAGGDGTQRKSFFSSFDRAGSAYFTVNLPVNVCARNHAFIAQASHGRIPYMRLVTFGTLAASTQQSIVQPQRSCPISGTRDATLIGSAILIKGKADAPPHV